MYIIRLVVLSCLWCFFFFKQKTAYELRISDWSSDVCSSDLRLNALSLIFVDHAGQHLAEMRMLGTGMDVLPAIGLQERGPDGFGFLPADWSSAGAGEIGGVSGGLRLKDAVDGAHQRDEIIDALVAFGIGQTCMMPLQFQLIEDRVLAFLFPVIEENILEQRRKRVVRVDAPAIVQLREQQIGQASCWGRGCEYVKISVAAIDTKKNT